MTPRVPHPGSRGPSQRIDSTPLVTLLAVNTLVGVGKDPVRLEFLKICPPAEINCWAFMQEILRPREGMMMTLDLREKLDL